MVQSKTIEKKLYEIISELKKELHFDDVQVESHLAMLAVVGRAMRRVPGMSGKLLSVLGDQQINIRTLARPATSKAS